MDRTVRRFSASALFAACLGTIVCSSASAQTLVGDTVSWWSQPQLTGVVALRDLAVVVTPGHEFLAEIDGFPPPLYSLNIEATSIRLDSISGWNSPYFNSGFDPSYAEIRGLDFVGEPGRFIVGVEVFFSTTITPEQFAPVNWPNFSASNVTFTADTVRLSYGGYQFPEGSFVHINLLTAVPAPGVAALLGLGGCAAMRRPRRR